MEAEVILIDAISSMYRECDSKYFGCFIFKSKKETEEFLSNFDTYVEEMYKCVEEALNGIKIDAVLRDKVINETMIIYTIEVIGATTDKEIHLKKEIVRVVINDYPDDSTSVEIV